MEILISKCWCYWSILNTLFKNYYSVGILMLGFLFLNDLRSWPLKCHGKFGTFAYISSRSLLLCVWKNHCAHIFPHPMYSFTAVVSSISIRNLKFAKGLRIEGRYRISIAVPTSATYSWCSFVFTHGRHRRRRDENMPFMIVFHRMSTDFSSR